MVRLPSFIRLYLHDIPHIEWRTVCLFQHLLNIRFFVEYLSQNKIIRQNASRAVFAQYSATDFQYAGQFAVGYEPFAVEGPLCILTQFIEYLFRILQALENILYTGVLLPHQIVFHFAWFCWWYDDFKRLRHLRVCRIFYAWCSYTAAVSCPDRFVRCARIFPISRRPPDCPAIFSTPNLLVRDIMRRPFPRRISPVGSSHRRFWYLYLRFPYSDSFLLSRMLKDNVSRSNSLSFIRLCMHSASKRQHEALFSVCLGIVPIDSDGGTSPNRVRRIIVFSVLLIL